MDPIFALATPFRATELKSASKKMLVQPPSYDRSTIEAMWRHCSRNRMRTNRRMPLTLNDLSSGAVVEDNLCSENSVVVAQKKLQTDVTESGSGDESMSVTNCDTDKADSVEKSGNGDLTGTQCLSNDGDHSSNNSDTNFVKSELGNVSSDQSCHNDSGVPALCNDTSQPARRGLNVEDCWWNKVDSCTWLQGLQSYLLLHSSVGIELHQMPVAVLPTSAMPYSMIANSSNLHQAAPLATTESAVAETNSVRTEHQYARQVLAPVTGYRVSMNGVLSAVPVCYFPIVNYTAGGPAEDASAADYQQTYIGAQQSSLASVDLVSFMHNYCLPPSSTPQSSSASAPVQTTYNAVSRHFVSSPVSLSSSGPDTWLMTGVAKSDESSLPSVIQHTEINRPNSGPESSGFLSSSTVWMTPRSLSSNSSAESLADDVSEQTFISSTVAVKSDESGINSSAGSWFSADADLTIPGWFGKGLGVRRSKRRLSRQF